MSEQISPYGHSICWMVQPVRETLERYGVEYRYVDILGDEAVRELLRSVNQGFESVPTLVFPDGSTLTEPGGIELEAKLENLGYSSPPKAPN